jgi:hypothetical protein
MFMIHKTLSNKIKLKTNAEPIYKISFLKFSSGFFSKKDIIMHLLLNKCLKT